MIQKNIFDENSDRLRMVQFGIRHVLSNFWIFDFFSLSNLPYLVIFRPKIEILDFDHVWQLYFYIIGHSDWLDNAK